jgi:OOP family OmpA-OmpF porin
LIEATVAKKAFVASAALGLVNLLALDLYFGPRVFRASAPVALVQDRASLPNEAGAIEPAPVGIPSVVRGTEPRVVARFETQQSASIVDDELRKLAAELAADPTVDIVLEGHSDPLGDAEYNKSLSLERAIWARNRLVSFGVSPSRIQAVGLGSMRTLESTSDSVAVNRRVEARFVPHGTLAVTELRAPTEPAHPRLEDARAPVPAADAQAAVPASAADAQTPRVIEEPADGGGETWIP